MLYKHLLKHSKKTFIMKRSVPVNCNVLANFVQEDYRILQLAGNFILQVHGASLFT